jgi:hypothetical protein
MSDIIDASVNCTGAAAALRRAGVKTVFRYYSRDSKPGAEKRLHRDEAVALAKAGLRIGAFYEGKLGDTLENFSAETGKADADYARRYASEVIGQPAGSTIYFGVDFDVDHAGLTERVIPYFEAVAASFAADTGKPHYDIGAYGSGYLCRMLLDRELVSKTFLAQSTGWKEYDSFLSSRRWTVWQQYGDVIGGIECDPDVAGAGSIGDFVLSGITTIANSAVNKVVNARGGLHLRGGPGVEFEVRKLLPYGTPLYQIGTSGSWTQVDLEGDGAADGYVSSGYLSDDSDRAGEDNRIAAPNAASGSADLFVGSTTQHDFAKIPQLIAMGRSEEHLATARKRATEVVGDYPHMCCAAFLSSLLEQAGIDVPMTPGAGKIAWRLEQRGWQRIKRGLQQPGDVGVAYSITLPEGADHVYLVIEVFDAGRMLIADNRNANADAPHERWMDGHKTTGTDYFLRAV